MRTLFWILLLGNAILFAGMQWGSDLIVGERMGVAQAPLHADKIRILTDSMLDLEEIPVAEGEPVAPADKPDASICLEWGDFSGADLTRATAALSELQLGDKLSQYQVEHAIGYWVYIPPLKDKAAVARKIAQLKARGIEEYFVVSDPGPWLNAVSLGVFKTQEAAQDFLDELQRTRDIRTAQVGERASKFKTTVFVLNGPDAATMAELTGVQNDFPGSTLKNVPCAHVDNEG